jgi:hypothetical protein
MSEWETFCDVGYYHMWRLRRKTERGWNDGFHINTKAEAEGLCELLNKLEGEVERERALANKAIATWKKTREERDVAEVKAERYRLEANTMMLQRDRLAKACDQYSEDEILCKLQEITEQRDEAREYADKLAEGLPDGMLPKDVEVLREANLGLATEVTVVTEQRDRLAEALFMCRKELVDVLDDINKERVSYDGDHFHEALRISQYALAAVKEARSERR